MKSIEMVEKMRAELIALVNQKCDDAIAMFQTGRCDENPEIEIKCFELGWGNPAVLKGKKPLAVRFASGECVEAPTWKKAVKIILEECNRQPQMHERLMRISGIVSGRQRVILGKNPQEMDVPLEIDKGLYFEAMFDTEALIRMMCEKVLNPIGYDYTRITIQYAMSRSLKNEQRNEAVENLKMNEADTEEQDMGEEKGDFLMQGM